MTEEKREVLELDYEQPKLSRNLSGRFFDGFVMAVLAVLLVIPALFIIQGNSFFQKMVEERSLFRTQSRLYVSTDGQDVILPYHLEDDEELTMREKDELMEDSLTFFFEEYMQEELQQKGKKIYLDYKGGARNEENLPLFGLEGERLLKSSDYDQIYFDFYSDLIRHKAIGYLTRKAGYQTVNRNIFMAYFFSILSVVLFSFLVVYYIIPLFFRKRRCTLGKLLTRTAMLGANAFSVSFWRYTLCFLLKLLVFVTSLFTFFVPLAIDITVLVMSKTHQNISEYVTNIYLVSAENQSIYRNYQEYHEATHIQEGQDFMDVDIL